MEIAVMVNAGDIGMKPQYLHVVKYGPNAWNFVPGGLKTVRNPKERGCKCNGNGDLGHVEISQDPRFKISRQIPCVCLYAVIDDSNIGIVAREINNHFINLRAEGLFCACMWCSKRREIEERNHANAS